MFYSNTFIKHSAIIRNTSFKPILGEFIFLVFISLVYKNIEPYRTLRKEHYNI